MLNNGHSFCLGLTSAVTSSVPFTVGSVHSCFPLGASLCCWVAQERTQEIRVRIKSKPSRTCSCLLSLSSRVEGSALLTYFLSAEEASEVGSFLCSCWIAFHCFYGKILHLKRWAGMKYWVSTWTVAWPGLSQTLGTISLLCSLYLGPLGSLCWSSYSARVMVEPVDRHDPAGLGAQWRMLSEVVDSVLEPGSHFLCDLGEAALSRRGHWCLSAVSGGAPKGQPGLQRCSSGCLTLPQSTRLFRNGGWLHRCPAVCLNSSLVLDDRKFCA